MNITVLFVGDNSRSGHRADSLQDFLEPFDAIYIGRFPFADPQIADHMVLVSFDHLDRLCATLCNYGLDVLGRIDTDGEVFLTDDAGKPGSWYRLRDGMRSAEDPPFAKPRNNVAILQVAPKAMSGRSVMLPAGVWEKAGAR